MPPGVRACTTTRLGGVSEGPWTSLNLAGHVGDAPAAVSENRRRLRSALRLPAEPHWLEQVHGTGVLEAGVDPIGARADACVALALRQVCVVLTADCLPLLFCDRRGRRVAAAHAGWRGLAAGVIEATLERLATPPGALLVWLGPAIGPQAFEVGEEVRDAFVRGDPGLADAFVPHGPGRWLADLYVLARRRLARQGVTAVWGGGLCTHGDRRRWYSYRRDGVTGRMASLIWRGG